MKSNRSKSLECLKLRLEYLASYLTIEDILELFNKATYIVDTNFTINSNYPKIGEYSYEPAPKDVTILEALMDVAHHEYILWGVDILREDAYYNLRYNLSKGLK
jgi:hypothetical protein